MSVLDYLEEQGVDFTVMHHEERYTALAGNIENGLVFKRPGPVVWRCLNCGYVHEGDAAPYECPACAHPQAHFALICENW